MYGDYYSPRFFIKYFSGCFVHHIRNPNSEQMTAEESRYISEVATREKGRLLGFIRQQVRSNEDAEDILQDVLYQFLRGFEDIRSTERITSWLFTVTRNRITDYYRKEKPESFSDRQVVSREEDGAPLMLEDILPALTRDPEDEMMRDMIWDAIDMALDEMPEDQRDVFIWNEFEDKNFKEIAAETGEGVNTLLSRKRYAILFLRKKLKELYNQL
jgi:RNA polymerase sigma factor (sigma-70 family)